MLVPRVQAVGRYQKPIAKQAVKTGQQQVSNAAKKLQQIALMSTLSAFAVSKTTDAKGINVSGDPDYCGSCMNAASPDSYAC